MSLNAKPSGGFRLNTRFTVADCDRVQRLARAGYTAGDVALILTGEGMPCTAIDVRQICEDGNTVVRLISREPAIRSRPR